MKTLEVLAALDAAFAVELEAWIRQSGVGKAGATILGVSRTQLWRLLNPETKDGGGASIEYWVRLAGGLHVPVWRLMERGSSPFADNAGDSSNAPTKSAIVRSRCVRSDYL